MGNCGICGTTFEAFHYCKKGPAYSQEELDAIVNGLNARRIEAIQELQKDLKEAKESDAESLKLYRAARDRADFMRNALKEIREKLEKSHDGGCILPLRDMVNDALGEGVAATHCSSCGERILGPGVDGRCDICWSEQR